METVTWDASGSRGCGALLGGGAAWFQFRCPAAWGDVTQELFPIVLATALWGSRWKGQRVLFRTDNQAIVSALTNYSAKDPPLVHLLRSLFFIEAHFDIEHSVVYVPGECNGAADALSRDRLTSFFSLLPQVSPHPQPLGDLLLDRSLSWTSPGWRDLLESSLRAASQQGP